MLPRTRARQDVYFDRFRAGPSSSDDSSKPDLAPNSTSDPAKA